MIDLEKFEKLAEIAKSGLPGDRMMFAVHAIDPEGMLDLIAEVRRLRQENMLCRAAIEDAVDMVDVCSSECEDDMSQGALRATKRQLSEAIGKACPRLLCERPEGQKMYGLRWQELTEENKALRDQRHELAGVVADVEVGRGFDSICLKTIKRVIGVLGGTPLRACTKCGIKDLPAGAYCKGINCPLNPSHSKEGV